MREFMEEEDLPQAALPEVCCMLRTKTAFGALVGHNAWQHGESTTAVYWCLRTMQTAGPDESFAHPHSCCAGRDCYKKEG
jgi:hypothetical protein